MSSPVMADTAIGTSCRRSERLVAVTMISCNTCISRGGVWAAVAQGACNAAVDNSAVNGNQAECRAVVMVLNPCRNASATSPNLYEIFHMGQFFFWYYFSHV